MPKTKKQKQFKQKTDEQIHEDIMEDNVLNFSGDKKPESAAKPRIKNLNLPQVKLGDNPVVKQISANFDFKLDAGKIAALVTAAVLIGFTIFLAFRLIPVDLIDQTEEVQFRRRQEQSASASAAKEAQIQSQLDEENKVLTFQNRIVDMTLKDFGTIRINLKDQAAPKTVENFIRLTYRKKYDGNFFHRIVKQPGFAVIQGGDFINGNGTGGETADGKQLVDELWTVKPEYDTANPNNPTLLNQPQFREPSLYLNYNPATGSVIYKKGLILMAKTSAPDSATSQFFITLTDTELPAEYTVFGVIEDSTMNVIDRINSEVKIKSRTDGQPETDQGDGEPATELKIEKAELVQ